jgi:hypothetical protein
MREVHHAGGTEQSETFLVNIALPNKVNFKNVDVTLGKLPQGTDVLIGMDIINSGDFSVTNFNGQTVFSFRYPSLAEIDFLKEIPSRTAPPSGLPPKQFGMRRKRGK